MAFIFSPFHLAFIKNHPNFSMLWLLSVILKYGIFNRISISWQFLLLSSLIFFYWNERILKYSMFIQLENLITGLMKFMHSKCLGTIVFNAIWMFRKWNENRAPNDKYTSDFSPMVEKKTNSHESFTTLIIPVHYIIQWISFSAVRPFSYPHYLSKP